MILNATSWNHVIITLPKCSSFGVSGCVHTSGKRGPNLTFCPYATNITFFNESLNSTNPTLYTLEPGGSRI